jgi:hypothetical protein
LQAFGLYFRIMSFLNEFDEPCDPPRGADTKQEFVVGIRFQPLGKDINRKDGIAWSHWVLVLTPINGPDWSLRVELKKHRKGAISFPAHVFDHKVNNFPLCTWRGKLKDITELIQAHPMRYSTYSACWSNCQHWVATMLVFMLMQALPKTKPGRALLLERYWSMLVSQGGWPIKSILLF